MRGKVAAIAGLVAAFGITPAYAGKSSESSGDFLPIKDHPRLCGEKLTVCNLQEVGIGSPPPMRGKGHGKV